MVHPYSIVKRRWAVTATAFLVVLTSSFVAGGGRPAEASDRVTQIGVSLPTYHYSVANLDAWESKVGTRADVLQTFVSWEYTGQPSLSAFPYWRALEFAAHGTTLEVTWVPSNPALGIDQPRFSLASIAAGQHDDYVQQFAADVRRFGKDVRIRFGHEMNGTWQPFAESNSDNRQGDFVAAWRHLVDVFASTGTTNVTWVWSPNILYAGGPANLASLYPGDEYVDLVGIDGYSYARTGCPSPDRLFGATLDQIRSFTARPVVIAETGVSTTCSSRDTWVTTLMEWIAAQPDIVGVTWWERAAGREDYRVTTSATTASAYRAGVAQLR